MPQHVANAWSSAWSEARAQHHSLPCYCMLGVAGWAGWPAAAMAFCALAACWRLRSASRATAARSLVARSVANLCCSAVVGEVASASTGWPTTLVMPNTYSIISRACVVLCANTTVRTVWPLTLMVQKYLFIVYLALVNFAKTLHFRWFFLKIYLSRHKYLRVAMSC